MTTILVTKKAVYTDSAMNDSGLGMLMTRRAVKAAFSSKPGDEGSIWAAAGDTHVCQQLLDYVAGKSNYDHGGESDCINAVKLTKAGEIFLLDANLRQIPILEPYFAVGSGAPFALAVMDMSQIPPTDLFIDVDLDALAEIAMKIAVTRDPWSEGPIVRYDLTER